MCIQVKQAKAQVQALKNMTETFTSYKDFIDNVCVAYFSMELLNHESFIFMFAKQRWESVMYI